MKYKISQILTQVQNSVQVNPSERYKLLGLRLEGRGLFIREDKVGIEISATSLNKVQKGDFVYSRLFAWKGAFDYVREGFDDCYVSNEFPTFEIDKNIVNIDYLFYYFNQKKVWKEIEQYCIGVTKASRNRFKEKFFLSMTIDLPVLSEQESIVAKLHSVASNIRNLKELDSKQEKEANNLKYSLYTDLVKEAKLVKMAKIAPIIRRPVEIIPEENYPELGIRCFGNGTFHKPALSGLEVGTKKMFQIKTGDLIFSNVFAWEGGIAVAQSEDNNRYGSHRFISCNCDLDQVLPEFLNFHFLTPKGLDEIIRCSPGGAGRNKTLGLKKLEAIKVPVPDIDEQRKFVNLLNQFKQLDKKRIERENELSELIPSLLDKAFKGEI
jgi:type I restriction enzyme S subunit